jgi:iron complex transport system substrate-binding protein
MSVGNGQILQITLSPRRVVSLVPSVTESLFDLGLGSALVGITDYCTQPAAKLTHLPRLGGPKNPRVADIISLQPDLVLANKEENTRQVVEALQAAGITVWVSFPRTVQDAIEVLYKLAEFFRSQSAHIIVKTLEQSVEWAQMAAAAEPHTPYFCPIWQDTTESGQHWWMTFNHETYTHDLLAMFGGENVFATRKRRYPLSADLTPIGGKPILAEDGETDHDPARDTRYPRVGLEEVRVAAPDVILLPSEPFAFSEEHRQQMIEWLSDTPAVQNDRVYLVDGSLLTWHGTRIARALQELPFLFSL